MITEIDDKTAVQELFGYAKRRDKDIEYYVAEINKLREENGKLKMRICDCGYARWDEEKK